MAEPDNFEEDLFADLYVHFTLETFSLQQLVLQENGHFMTYSSASHSRSIISAFENNANVDSRYTEDDSASKPTVASAVKSEPAAAPVVKTEEAERNGNGDGNGDEQMYGGDQDDDDDEEIDFNLGKGVGAEQGYDAPPSHHEAHGPGIKEDG
jgi:hypothetical protein